MKRFKQLIPVLVFSSLTLALIFPQVITSDNSVPVPVIHREQTRIKQGLSTNWSGYAAETSLTNPKANSVSFVQGDWVVPTLSCSGLTTYSSAWVGIDGYSSSTVEQIGTEHECHSGASSYYVWYEMYPKSMRAVNLKINPGDKIHGEVSYTGNYYFRLTLKNLTTANQFSTTQRTRAQRSSAEWVAEAPSSYFGVLPLANFGTLNFSNSQATINGHTGAINDAFWQNDPITMVNNSLVAKAIPSSLDPNGTSFSVTWASN